MKKDYSEYQYTEYDKYLAEWTAPKGVMLSYFINHVRVNPDEKRMTIIVDSNCEEISMKDDIEKYRKEQAEREGEGYKAPNYQSKIKIEAETELMEECVTRLTEMRKKYGYTLNFIDGFPYEEPDLLREPLINVFSGAEIRLNYGEGILDFIYADFKTPLQDQLDNYEIEKLLTERGRELFEIQQQKNKIREQNTVEKVYNELQEFVELFFDYEATFIGLSDLLYASLYSAICPPVMNSSFTGKKGRLTWYGKYLLRLQKEFKEMIEFCYDEDFYPELLGKMYPHERLRLYHRVHGFPRYYQRTEDITLDKLHSYSPIRPYGISAEELVHIFETADFTPTEEAKEFAKKYNISANALMHEIRTPAFLNIGYKVSTVEEMLELEFTKMLEQDVRFRKCKRCGKYFIMKGNYDTKYCSRIAEGETRSCQELAAIDNYKAKIADDKAIPIYNRYYKRYAARVKVRQIKEEDFKKWKYQAMDKRNQCSDGKITPEEYIEWMEASFPNRKPKPKE